MTDDSADKVPAGSEPEESPERRSDEEPRGTRVGGGCLLFFIIAALSGGAYFYYLYAREGSVSRAIEVLRASSEDAALSAKVKAAFALSKRVSTFDIGVSSRRGVVTLSGRVPTPHARDLVEAIASNVTGVQAVQNEVSVDPAALPDPEIERLNSRVVDLEIKTGVLEALQRTPELSPLALRVDVVERSVSLSGSVSSQELSRLAEAAARGVDGVQAVRNEIVVTQPEASAPVAADDALAARVAESLARSGAFAPGSIEVLLNATRVTLRGKVRSVAERLLAEVVARQTPGVEAVVNELRLEPEAREGTR